jgi:hypothetical protein
VRRAYSVIDFNQFLLDAERSEMNSRRYQIPHSTHNSPQEPARPEKRSPQRRKGPCVGNLTEYMSYADREARCELRRGGRKALASDIMRSPDGKASRPTGKNGEL